VFLGPFARRALERNDIAAEKDDEKSMIAYICSMFKQYMVTHIL